MEAKANTELYPLPEDAKVPFLNPGPALTDERDPTLDGLIEQPYKDSVKQGVRIHSLVCLPAEVQWVNEANDKAISRAGLNYSRVTTVHVRIDEKRSAFCRVVQACIKDVVLVCASR